MTIQLGLDGAEQDLVQEGLVLGSVNIDNGSSETRAADRTLHIDYRPVKRLFTLSYRAISKSNYDALVAIYNLQVDNLADLKYKITEDSGVKSYTVRMRPVPRGGDLRDRPYYNNVTIELVEV